MFRNLFLVKDYRAVFIDQDCQYINIINQIRRSDQTATYLKPVFLKKTSSEAVGKYLHQIVDGICEDDDVYKYYRFSKALVDKVNYRIVECLKKTQKTMPNEFDLFLKVIRYLYTRGTMLNPVRYAKSVYGYIYPAVNVYFTKVTYQEFRLLEFLEKKNLIEGTFIDNIHTCNYCYSSFLNFREICTNCGSVNITDEDLVHHFPVGIWDLKRTI